MDLLSLLFLFLWSCFPFLFRPFFPPFFVSCFGCKREGKTTHKNEGGVLLLLSPTSTHNANDSNNAHKKSGQKPRGPRDRQKNWRTTKRMTRKEKIFALAKGFRGRAKNCFRVANQRVEKALQYAYRDRRTKKREARKEWIVRINAASREHGVKYAEFIRGIGVDNVCLDRKILAELAVNEPKSFRALCERVKKMRAATEPLPKIEVREEEC